MQVENISARRLNGDFKLKDKSDAISQAAALRQEIAQRNNELQRLETLSKQVRESNIQHSYVEISGPPRHIQPLATENVNVSVGTRSASTGRHIETLQREVDGLKFSTESFKSQLKVEKKAKEAMNQKYETLTATMDRLRIENNSLLGSLTHRDRALKEEQELRKQTEAALANIEKLKAEREVELRVSQEALCATQSEILLQQKNNLQKKNEFLVLSECFEQTKLVTLSKTMKLREDLDLAEQSAVTHKEALDRTIARLDEMKVLYNCELANLNAVHEGLRSNQEATMQQLISDLAAVRQSLNLSCETNDRNDTLVNQIRYEMQALYRRTNALQ